MSKQRRVTPRPDGRWQEKVDGNSRASSVHDTQARAIAAARTRARSNGEELSIHGRDGRIRAKDSYGNDPYPPKDKR